MITAHFNKDLKMDVIRGAATAKEIKRLGLIRASLQEARR